MKKYLPHFFFVFLLCAFIFKGAAVLDPDLGWHLKMGEYILRHGIPANDPFSYTMPSYPFVDHEWLTNILLYAVYHRAGYPALVFLFAALAAVLVLQLSRTASGGWRVLMGAVILSVLLPFAGVRPQEISWLFAAVFLLLLQKESRRWLLVLLMLLWVNLHGSFFVGVFLVGLYAALRIFQRQPAGRDMLLFFAVLAATLANPYGWRIWWEVWMQLTDTALRFTISEWMPAVYFLNYVYWLFAVFAAVVVIKYYRSVPLFPRVLFALLFIAGLMSMRNIPLWIIASVYPISAGLQPFLREAGKTAERKRRLRFVQVRLAAVVAIVASLQLVLIAAGSVSAISYPEKAVAYIKSHRPAGRILAAYGWGGYLIWNLPSQKVFIDGRMPSWRRVTAPPGESTNARRDYDDFLKSEEGMRRVGERYGIDYVLMQSEPEMTDAERLIRRLFSLKPPQKPALYRLPVLYDDGVATIRVLR